jgi:hypothetical protein
MAHLENGKMNTLPIVFVMLSFRILGAGDDLPKWQVHNMFRTKAECVSSMKEVLASERIHRSRLECIPYAATKKPVPLKDWKPDPDMYK